MNEEISMAEAENQIDVLYQSFSESMAGNSNYVVLSALLVGIGSLYGSMSQDPSVQVEFIDIMKKFVAELESGVVTATKQ